MTKRSIQKAMKQMQIAGFDKPKKKIKRNKVAPVAPPPLASENTDLQPHKPKKKVVKMCQSRAFELVYDPVPKTCVIKPLCAKKFGIYMMFTVKHTLKDGSSHLHCGVYLRDPPMDRTFTWGHGIIEYFTLDGIKPKVRPLGNKSRKPANKLQTYYDYCVNKEKHPDEIMGEPNLWKFIPKVVIQGIELKKCPTRHYVYYYYINGKTFREIFNEANIARQADMMHEFKPIKNMLRTYDAFTQNNTVFHPVESFHPDAVKEIYDTWKPKYESLILKGPSNMGKTELAKAIILAMTKKRPLFCSNLNKLGVRDPHQPILYDDMNFANISREKAIFLTDIENDRDIRILYGIHTVEAGTCRIFTTNEDVKDLLPLFKDTHGAIKRRFRVVDLTRYGKLYKTYFNMVFGVTPVENVPKEKFSGKTQFKVSDVF